MLKIIRWILYSLAILTGVLGLIVGSIPLVKYVSEMLHGDEYSDFSDMRYLAEPEIILLLSLILLTGVRICLALDRKIPPAGPADAIKKVEAFATAKANILAPASSEPIAPPAESPDEKLTRLLNQKKG